MLLFRGKPLIGAAAAIALCVSPTVATAATNVTITPVQSISPLVAVSVFGTQASAQEVCANAAGAAAAAVAAQGQAGCVLPATDAAPPPADVGPPPVVESSGIGITPIILGLLGLAGLAALIASGNGDSDSPISPS